MNYPTIQSLTSDNTLTQVFKTYKISFDIIGNRYEFEISVCIGRTKENTPYVDILDVMNVYLNGEKKSREEAALIISNIATMFGQGWYENAVKEQALKDWENISFDAEKSDVDMDEILETIQSEIDSFCFEDFADTDITHNHSSVTVEAIINRNDIERELFNNIKTALRNK